MPASGDFLISSLSSIQTVEWMLEEWSRWARAGHGLALYYPAVEPYERMRGAAVKSVLISDDEAEMVDRVVSQLVKTYPAEGDALAYYYLVTREYGQIAKHMRHHGHMVDRRRVPELIRAAKLWTDGRLKY